MRRRRDVLHDHRQRCLLAPLAPPPACWAPRISPWSRKSCVLSETCSWSTLLGALPTTYYWQTAR